MPLGLIRRGIKTVLLPKIRSTLSMQPLPMRMAQDVDRALAHKVSLALGVEYRDTTALTLPLHMLGLGFPSIVHVNGEVAFDALLRQLNHPLAPFKDIAKSS